jgi:hypothetical protein
MNPGCTAAREGNFALAVDEVRMKNEGLAVVGAGFAECGVLGDLFATF